MSLTDLIIVYLACGAPFGVYYFTTFVGKGNVFGRAFAAFFFWPVLALKLLIEKAAADPRHNDLELTRIRLRMESDAFLGAAGTDLFEYRRSFNRYAGLALTKAGGSGGVHELFPAIGHPNSELASACISRRSQRKIHIHLEQARHEFITLVAPGLVLAEAGAVSDRISELSSLVGDPEILTLFLAILPTKVDSLHGKKAPARAITEWETVNR